MTRKKSRILIHALGATMGGAMRHLVNFLPELGRIDSRHEYVVLVRHSFPSVDLAGNIQLERIPDDQCSSWGRRIFGDVVSLPNRLRRERFAAVVSLTNFGPIWSSVPHVCFQRNPIYFSRDYEKRVVGRQRMENRLRRRLALESMKRADVIVTPSRAMGAMIRERCPELQNRSFHTLYHGFSKVGFSEPLAREIVQQLDGSEGFRLLYPTHPAPHKGFDVLFRALAHLKRDGVRFRLFTTIAVEDWPIEVLEYKKQIAALDLGSEVVFLGRVSQGQMGALYGKCDLMVYPSLCESFGFSMVEALGHGLPIVAADTPVNREMCEDGAIYYPPLDADAGASAIARALEPGMRERLRQAGAARLESFDWSWRRYAAEFVEMIGMVSP